jgi:N12 class adenine-specific DNA methylase
MGSNRYNSDLYNSDLYNSDFIHISELIFYTGTPIVNKLEDLFSLLYFFSFVVLLWCYNTDISIEDFWTLSLGRIIPSSTHLSQYAISLCKRMQYSCIL